MNKINEKLRIVSNKKKEIKKKLLLNIKFNYMISNMNLMGILYKGGQTFA